MSRPLMVHWSLAVAELFETLQSSPAGLTGEAVTMRLEQLADERIKPRRRSRFAILLAQFKSPIIWLLSCSAVLSFLLEDQTNGVIILLILFVSSLLGYWQEQSAADAVAKLLAVIETHATVLRDGREVDVSVDSIVPGDIVQLHAGSLVPGDCRVIDSTDLFVDEAALTGETFPAEKSAGTIAADTPLARRTNTLCLGTHVVSGTASALVVHVGRGTEFGRVSSRLETRPPETGFERGLREFGNLLIMVVLVFVVFVFGINVAFQRPVVESLLFALALAVGMTPQLLPAITSVVLARGAKSMADAQVIVKQLLSIENFGSMTILCSDKTGTLTEGIVQFRSAADASGDESSLVYRYAYFNAVFESGFSNPIDKAIRTHQPIDLTHVSKLSEIPYDFIRKRLSVLVSVDGSRTIVTKGALIKILEVCTTVELPAGERVELATHREMIERRFADWSVQGLRVLGLAIRHVDVETIDKAYERDMTFLGFLVFDDPPKPGIIDTVRELERLGIRLKIVTGDNRAVTEAISHKIGLPNRRVLTGNEMRLLSDESLNRLVRDVDLFAEVEPNQKERIILALKKSGDVVGYMGDGINDASALHAADVGISVAGAVDVAREAAQVVLLRRDLSVLIQGVLEGRRTLANTLKYVYVSISANFGYMFSMAMASLFLRFLPLLPTQILLINLLADFPAMMLATDSVDPELIQRPRRWDVERVRKFMMLFGWSSSTFDFLTFGVLLFIYQADIDQFRTGFFIESVLTGLLIMLIVRTERPLFQSQPGRYLLAAALIIAAITLALPYLDVGRTLGFTPPPASLLLLIGIIAVLYAIAMEVAKTIFYGKRATMTGLARR